MVQLFYLDENIYFPYSRAAQFFVLIGTGRDLGGLGGPSASVYSPYNEDPGILAWHLVDWNGRNFDSNSSPACVAQISGVS
ncbi:hypothetical protein DPMN_005266 [Dreissena polymorpha]|uniref:Uncharacterized protein n=1 Tax=Dreissena polymorpha TaxID=45954 RepID=A0A9D4RTR0_DREPO|nr:hypothetical protein DPMN_005266 [Dreissena polymorpha]